MTTFEHAELRHNAIKVLCNASATTEFKAGRDATLPEFYMHATEKLDGRMEDETGLRRPPQRRDILAFFAAQMHGRVRPKLLEYWEYPKGGKEMHVLDWTSFSVTLAEKELPSLKSILQGISESEYMTMQERLQYVRRHFTWHETPQPFDTFHMILHSVWTSRLTNIMFVKV
ncbi:hypothetical protein L7F22_006288 [Adiantum nelumboides]|nr:hypothetical protein [Adiantum nelumboides]